MKSECLICQQRLAPFLDLGMMPISNDFHAPTEPDDGFRYRLAVARCPSCQMVQLMDPVNRERMFHDHYAYYSSTSQRMARHFSDMADWVLERVDDGSPFIVELGSNDGILLQHFARRGVRHLGVEPSANVARVAIDKGLRTQIAFFDIPVADEILRAEGHAAAICGANVLCHLPHLGSVLAGVDRLLTPRGIFVFEDPYLPVILERTAFDQFYDEHAWYFSATAIDILARRHGFAVVDAVPQPTHGGSMRFVLARAGTREVAGHVGKLLAQEKHLGLDRHEPFAAFAGRVERTRADLIAVLDRIRAEGKKTVGYGATAKSATVLNYCGIGTDHVQAICDTTPIKQGTISPGAHIPVISHETFAAAPPDYALLFAWNHLAEILEKEQRFRAGGGRFIVYVPAVHLI